MGIALYPPADIGPPLSVFVAGNLGGEQSAGNVVFLNKYDLNGNLIDAVKWGGPSTLRRAVAVKTIKSVGTGGNDFVCVLVQEPAKGGTTDVLLLVYDAGPVMIGNPRYTFYWSYQPYPGFRGNDIPIAMDAIALPPINNTAIAYIAVTVQSEGTTPGVYDSQALLWTGGNGEILPQAFDNSRVSYGSANTIPVGVAIIPPHPNFAPNPYGSVFIAGTVQPVTNDMRKYFVMGYRIEGAAGDPVPYMPNGPRIYAGTGGRHHTATAMAGGFRIERPVGAPEIGGENIYLTGYASPLTPPGTSNWVTVKWRSLEDTPGHYALQLVPEWVNPPPSGELNLGEYDGVAGLNDYPRAIELREVGYATPHGTALPRSYIWVTGSTQTANGTYDAALIQYQDYGGGGSKDWDAQLANVIEGPFAADDIPISITSSENPSPVDGASADIFITAQSRSWTGDWDFLHFKYNSARPPVTNPPTPKHPDWWIFSSAWSGSGADIPSGIIAYPYAASSFRNYYKMFAAGTSLDVSPANGGNDSLVVKYSEPFP